MTFIMVYVTHENELEAEKVTDYLLENKLVACSNMFHIKSKYWWRGKIEKANEVVTIYETKAENWEQVKNEIKKIHPYEVPCIIQIEADSNTDYRDWIKSVTK